MAQPSRFYEYASCSTCKKARRWLDAHGAKYEIVPIVEKPPSKVELRALIGASGVAARKWFNTSGLSYRALVAKLGRDAVDALTDDQIIERLAADGKLIKRPVLSARGKVLVGFREDAYEALFG